jgi:putative tricarboxylic transport membrane protein
VAGSLALVFMLPLGFQLLRTQTPSAVFYDTERDSFEQGMTRRSAEHYLLWLVAMLGVAALVGFVIGIAGFIYTFMRVKARCAHWACAMGAAIFVLLLGVLSNRLALEYPQGLLQSYLTLPWPLQ